MCICLSVRVSACVHACVRAYVRNFTIYKCEPFYSGVDKSIFVEQHIDGRLIGVLSDQ